ncbi:MAG: ACT domain-containing protein, partial [Lachnospiraceae bacterium]|nr:ACT domain-containing protein [Lachnospiraceae bacterium]
MELKKLDGIFTVCKVEDFSLVNIDAEYCFIGKTDEEKSLVCLT